MIKLLQKNGLRYYWVDNGYTIHCIYLVYFIMIYFCYLHNQFHITKNETLFLAFEDHLHKMTCPNRKVNGFLKNLQHAKK